MAKGLNKVLLIGSVDDEPESRQTPGGQTVTSFTVATTRTWTPAEGQAREETEWFNVVAWGNLAEICQQRLVQGQQVYVEGRLQTRRWQDSSGKSFFRTEVVAQEVITLASSSVLE